MVKTLKFVSICLMLVLLASLFLVSDAFGIDGDTISLSTDVNDAGDCVENGAQQYMDQLSGRYVNSPITVGQFNLSGLGSAGIYGAHVVYGDSQGNGSSMWFIPSLVVKSIDGWCVDKMRITVTASYPNGAPVPVGQFVDGGHIITPYNPGVQWESGLSNVVRVLGVVYPTISISNSVESGTQNSGGSLNGWTVTHDSSAYSVWAEFQQDPFVVAPSTERGFQYYVELLCNQYMSGVYVINVNYDITLSDVNFPAMTSVSFNQQITS